MENDAPDPARAGLVLFCGFEIGLVQCGPADFSISIA
jgi:hypothetical protein